MDSNQTPATQKRVNTLFCLIGWYFGSELYRTLREIPDADVFVVSHKPRKTIPPEIFSFLAADRVLIRPNIGYDWGAYQQFLETGLWKDYEYLFFLQDDVIIRDVGFVTACRTLLDQGYKVIGNNRSVTKTDWPRTHPQCYAHSTWKPPSRDFQHEIVRGSFFATSRQVLEEVGDFEVFWDRFRVNLGFGNWSLVASCGKVRERFGERTFAYLSDSYEFSRFIKELKRGGVGKKELPKTFGLAPALARFSRICEEYFIMHLNREFTLKNTIRMHLYSLIIRMIAGR